MKNEIDIIRLLKILRNRLNLHANMCLDGETSFALFDDILACDFHIHMLDKLVSQNTVVEKPVRIEYLRSELDEDFAKTLDKIVGRPIDLVSIDDSKFLLVSADCFISPIGMCEVVLKSV